MDKKSKELMRKHKKVRPASSSESSSSSDSDSGSSDSYSSSSSDKKAVHRKGKKVRARRSSSSSDEERARKRDKHACHRKLEAKKMHLKRKLKEAKAAKKRGISPSMRRRSISPHKLKKIPVPGSSAEKKHHQLILKERMLKEKEREREKIRLNRERMAAAGRPIIVKEPKSRSPSKAIRCREIKQRKSPGSLEQQTERHQHHQISPREKIIIQTRRDRSPSERTKGPKDIRHRLDDRRERERAEAARQKEREEALARCQERQRERERIAREKQMRRDKEFDRDRLLPRPAEREMALAAARAGNSRDRSIEPTDIRRPGHSHGHSSSRQPGRNEIDYERENYDRERAFPGRSMEREDRRGGSISGDIDRDYLVVRHREISSPAGQSGHYSDRQRGSDREIYPDDERYEHHDNYAATQQRIHSRGGYIPPIDEPTGPHHRRGERGTPNWEPPGHREREPRSTERDWKSNKEEWDNQHWNDPNWQQKQQQPHSRKKPGLPISKPEENWDDDDGYAKLPPSKKPKTDWNDPALGVVGNVVGRIKHDHGRGDDHPALLPGPHDAPPHPVPHQPHIGRRWPQQEWRPRGPAGQIHVPGGPAPVNFRHNAPPIHPHPMDYTHERPDFRRQPHHFPTHLPHHHPVGYHHPPRPHFPSKRQMTYTNPNLLQNQKAAQQARLAAAAAAAAAAQLSNTLTGTSTTITSAFPVTTTPSVTGTQSIITSKIPLTTITSKPLSTITTTSTTSSSATTTTATEPSTSVIGTENILEKISDSSNETTEENDSKKLESGEIAEESSGDGVTDSGQPNDEVIPDDLSEISDEADEILNKDEELAKNSAAKNKIQIIDGEKSATTTHETIIKSEILTKTTENNSIIGGNASNSGGDIQITGGDSNDKDLNDDLLDFEEISDGELEEESRKNLGDALGVDWASLVRDTKVQTAQTSEEYNTTAKQKWQPHRVILDIGISFKFAGEEFAKKLLNDAKQKLNEEQQQAIKNKIENKINGSVATEDIKSELKIKVEQEDVEEFGEMSTTTTASNESDIKNEDNCVTEKIEDDSKEDDDNMSGIACVQVAKRRAKEIRKNLVFNACGPNSRALSAGNDLNLRRQLCGLPVTQIDRPRKVSEKLKVLAIQAFQKAAAIGEVQ